MTSKKLNYDQRGHKGEKYFEYLCAEGGLNLNQAVRDRRGWDYYIEFNDQETNEPFDRRPSPPECKAQIKTTTADKSIDIALFPLEKLAKFHGMACIFVLQEDENQNIFEIYAVHISEPLLSRVLKKCREYEASLKQAKKPAKKPSFTLDFKHCGVPLAVDGKLHGKSISSWIDKESKIHFSMGFKSYDAFKCHMLTTLGYNEKFNHSGVVELDNQYLDDYMEACATGTTYTFPVVSFKATDTRFGIPIVKYPDVTSFTIKPKWTRCSLQIDDGTTEVTFVNCHFYLDTVSKTIIVKDNELIVTYKNSKVEIEPLMWTSKQERLARLLHARDNGPLRFNVISQE